MADDSWFKGKFPDSDDDGASDENAVSTGPQEIPPDELEELEGSGLAAPVAKPVGRIRKSSRNRILLAVGVLIGGLGVWQGGKIILNARQAARQADERAASEAQIREDALASYETPMEHVSIPLVVKVLEDGAGVSISSAGRVVVDESGEPRSVKISITSPAEPMRKNRMRVPKGSITLVVAAGKSLLYKPDADIVADKEERTIVMEATLEK